MTYIKKPMTLNTITRVVIGVQARSTSKRFPGKVFEDICGKPMLQWVLDAAKDSAMYMSRPNLSRSVVCDVCLLIPSGDKIRDNFNRRVHIIEGPENDVLSRYRQCTDFFTADYVVRITGDCPMIPPPVITKAINVAVINGYDYVSNVDERLRLSFDGMDVEVISRRLIDYLDENIKDAHHREHVTTFVRTKDLPTDFTTAHIVGYLDLSGQKLSVDTPEDLERVRFHKQKVIDALRLSEEISGEKSTHRF